MTRVVTPAGFTFAAVVAASFGCGYGPTAPPNYGSEDGLKIAEMVADFNDAKADPAKFKKQFAGAVPANWKEYERHAYEVVVGSTKTDGTTTTADVAVRNDASNQPVGTFSWTFAKVGDSWKLKTAPLK